MRGPARPVHRRGWGWRPSLVAARPLSDVVAIPWAKTRKTGQPHQWRADERRRPTLGRQLPRNNAALHPCSGWLPGAWEGQRWVPVRSRNCQPVELPRDGPELLRCLSGRRLFFLGDSHVRNLYRCVADELTGGASARAVGRALVARNDPVQPDEWPKYSHLEMREGAGNTAASGDDPHRLSCSNAEKVHRVDYDYDVETGNSSTLRLSFLWNPWPGDAPLLHTPAALEQWGPDGAAYRFNYTGGRARDPLLAALSAKVPRPDLVITGGESRNHSALFRTFPGEALLIDHAGARDEMHGAAAKRGIAVADVSAALLALVPSFSVSPTVSGPHGTPRVSHVPEQVLRVQARLVLTLAAQKLCGDSPAVAGGRHPATPRHHRNSAHH
eukprot:jgi/Tetstr1/450162/TSEL_037204.t1